MEGSNTVLPKKVRAFVITKHKNYEQGANYGILFPYASKREMYL